MGVEECGLCGEPHLTAHHRAGIVQSPVFVALVTDHYVEEDYHHDEIELAAEHNIPLVAVVEDGTDWSGYDDYEWDQVIELQDRYDQSVLEQVAADIAAIYHDVTASHPTEL